MRQNELNALLVKNVYKMKKGKRYSDLQRRNKVVDFYGTEFTRQGDTNSPATFYISISQDLIYYERFEFKIIIQPFTIPIAGNGINSVVLSASIPSGTTGQSTLTVANDAISPNPHNHNIPVQTVDITPNPHTHAITAGVTTVPSTVGNFEIWIENINITPYLKAQYSSWVDGEGIFPSNSLSNYDILEAVGYMSASDRTKILSAGYKKIELKGEGLFNATLVNYLKYSHVNR